MILRSAIKKVVIDYTGLKFLGEGERKLKKNINLNIIVNDINFI